MYKSLALGVSMMVFLFAGLVSASEKKDIAFTMVDKAAAHYASAGAEKAHADFSKDGEYKNGEFYVVVFDASNGVVTYHGVNAKLIGKSLIKVKDTDGKTFVKDMMDIANEKGAGWISYKWPNPETKKIAQKHTYVKKTGDSVIMVGYYE